MAADDRPRRVPPDAAAARQRGARRPSRPSPACPKPDPILVADGVRRQFGGIVAVDVDHLEVQRGSITALIGPNGAGKTTFFNLMTGFDKPNSGDWTFDGNDDGRRRRRTRRRSCGMVRTFQLTKSLTKMSVIENMKLGATGQRGEQWWNGLIPSLWRSQETRDRGAGRRAARRASGSTTCATSTPARCRAASASCSRWRGR